MLSCITLRHTTSPLILPLHLRGILSESLDSTLTPLLHQHVPRTSTYGLSMPFICRQSFTFSQLPACYGGVSAKTSEITRRANHTYALADEANKCMGQCEPISKHNSESHINSKNTQNIKTHTKDKKKNPKTKKLRVVDAILEIC